MYLEDFIDSLKGKNVLLPRTIETYGGGETFKADFVEIAKMKGFEVEEKVSLSLMRKADHILLVNGLRDIPLLIFFTYTYRSKVIVYIQVPYHIKFIGLMGFMVSLFYWLSRKFPTYYGSKSHIKTEGSKILFPISRNRVEKLKSLSLKSCRSETFVFAFRLSREKGIQSRDIPGFINFSSDVKKNGGKVIHYGNVDFDFLKSYPGSYDIIDFVEFRGYQRNWMEHCEGIFIHMSNYDGFGLAPVEASLAGLEVRVSLGVPKEAFYVAPKIKRIG